MMKVNEGESKTMILKLDSSEKEKIRIGLCIEFDIYFDILLKDLDNIEELISNYKNLSECFPKNVFDMKINSLNADIRFLEELLFQFVDTKVEYCDYLYKYND